jgi:hypothetical protein
MLELSELLRLRGLDVEKTRTKIVRHASPHFDIDRLRREGFLEIYEEVQSEPRFDGCEYVVSCIGEQRTRSRLLWVVKVEGLQAPLRSWPAGYPVPTMSIGQYRYVLSKCSGFEDLVDRVAVDWGKSTRSWHQWLGTTGKPVIEILPKGFVRAFPGYDEVVLGHDELAAIVQEPDANRDWRDRLQRVAGVYLIVDSRLGRQYVTTATPEDRRSRRGGRGRPEREIKVENGQSERGGVNRRRRTPSRLGWPRALGGGLVKSPGRSSALGSSAASRRAKHQ